jgi:hypothetical protein
MPNLKKESYSDTQLKIFDIDGKVINYRKIRHITRQTRLKRQWFILPKVKTMPVIDVHE